MTIQVPIIANDRTYAAPKICAIAICLDGCEPAYLDEAIAAHDSRIEIDSLVRQIRTETEMDDRIIILEMIWMVVLADKQLDSHESQLMRRLAGLLYVDDVQSGMAAKRAQNRLGLAD